MPYADGFVLPIPKRNLATYRRIAAKAGKVWKEHGALEYRECVADDLRVMKGMGSFKKVHRLKPSETLLFSWIVYKSRKHRDQVNRKVMTDPRLAAMMTSAYLDWARSSSSSIGGLVIPSGADVVPATVPSSLSSDRGVIAQTVGRQLRSRIPIPTQRAGHRR